MKSSTGLVILLIIFPLKNKSVPEVARLIEERVLVYVGPPHIFHSDNGREFVNQILHSLIERWSSGNVTIEIEG